MTKYIIENEQGEFYYISDIIDKEPDSEYFDPPPPLIVHGWTTDISKADKWDSREFAEFYCNQELRKFTVYVDKHEIET